MPYSLTANVKSAQPLRNALRTMAFSVAFLAPLPAMADCISIGAGAEFCGNPDWTFEKYVDEGVLHIAADGANVYHLHRLREVGQDSVDVEVTFEKHAADFLIEYGDAAYTDVVNSQGERHGKRTLEYAFSVKEWEDGNRTFLTFLIDGDTGYSFVTSGQPPLDIEELKKRHEAAVAAFRLKAD